jgi:aryl-alcohol dehydrogenase-like predicted oxidoreductase
MSWCLANPAVVCVIPGASSVEQLEINMKAAVPLSADIKKALDDATEPLKQAIGPAVDIYEGLDTQRSF